MEGPEARCSILFCAVLQFYEALSTALLSKYLSGAAESPTTAGPASGSFASLAIARLPSLAVRVRAGWFRASA